MFLQMCLDLFRILRLRPGAGFLMISHIVYDNRISTVVSAHCDIIVIKQLSQFPWSWINPLKFLAMDTERPQKKERGRGEEQVSFLLLCHLPKSKLPLGSLEAASSPPIMQPYYTYNYHTCVYISTSTDM